MNSSPSLLAAGWLGPEGFGNDRAPLNSWTESLAARLSEGDLDGLHWSLLSDSDPSRFLRMDLMCRLGFMAAELLRPALETLTDDCRERVGICLETFTGSLDTDIRFARTRRPSIFAYTLPSTVIGEICIRFRLKGPVLSLVSTSPGGSEGLTEATDWLRRGSAERVICLSLEAMNRVTARSLPLIPELIPDGWHAAALLLGLDQTRTGSCPWLGETVREVARQRCVGPQVSC